MSVDELKILIREWQAAHSRLYAASVPIRETTRDTRTGRDLQRDWRVPDESAQAHEAQATLQRIELRLTLAGFSIDTGERGRPCLMLL